MGRSPTATLQGGCPVFPRWARAWSPVSDRPFYSLALLSDGTVRAWGSNYHGQLGDGTLSNRTVPVKVMKNLTTGEALSGVVALAAGYGHVLALDDSGKVWAWGKNFAGQLGDGSALSRRLARQVLKDPATGEALSGVVAIAAGEHHSLAVSDARRRGYNAWGQLGNGSMVNSSIPVQVPGVSGAVEVGAGEFYSHAVLADGSVRSWGDNVTGQLGDGTASEPPPHPGGGVDLSGVAFVDGSDNGGYYSLALKTDGSVWAWGNNSAGQLGKSGLGSCGMYSSPLPSLIPVQAQIDQVDSVSASVAVSLARRTDGTIWFWGSNVTGASGTGRLGGCAVTPVQVPFPSP